MKDLLLSGFIGYNYAQLIHLDNNDHGPTVVARITKTDPQAPNAFHLVQPTLECNGKRGIVWKQRPGTLSIFLAGQFIHSSSINECEPNSDFPSLGLGCVQKSKVLSVSERRSDVVDKFVSFSILKMYGLSPVRICDYSSTTAKKRKGAQQL